MKEGVGGGREGEVGGERKFGEMWQSSGRATPGMGITLRFQA